MSVNNYNIPCGYDIGDLSNFIYLYKFNAPILDYYTDKNTENGTSIDLIGDGYLLYCDTISYSSVSSNNSRFAFENTLTIQLSEKKQMTHYNVIQELLSNKWMVGISNKVGDNFIINAEFPVEITYAYNFNNSEIANVVTITLKVLQNIPTIYYNKAFTNTYVMREKPCFYTFGKVKSLKMIDYNRASVDVTSNGFTLNELGEGNLKTIDFLDTTLYFTEEYNGNNYTQTLSFQIPFNSYLYYFHYNLLEYLNNRYLALIETTNDNFILSGFRQGLFPSYTINSGGEESALNTITITLTSVYASFSLVASDNYELVVRPSKEYEVMFGECVDDVYTYTLLKEKDTNNYYCLNGFEDDFSGFNIVGTYTKYDTSFGFKLYDTNYDCTKSCMIDGLPSTITFTKSGETKTFAVITSCVLGFEYDPNLVDVRFDIGNNMLYVTNKATEGTYNISVLASDGITRNIFCQVNPFGEDSDQVINITAKQQNVTVIPLQGFYNVSSYTSSSDIITIIPNQNGIGYDVLVPANESVFDTRTFVISITYKDGSKERVTIIQDRLYEILIDNGETQCFGDDYYYVYERLIGYTPDNITIQVGNVKGNLIDTMSPICMEYDSSETVGTLCVEEKLYNIVNYIKDDVVIKTQLELEGSDCTDSTPYIEYRINTGITECVDETAYYVEELWASADGTNYYKIYPTKTRVSNQMAPDSSQCKVTDPSNPGTTQYRWVDTDDTYCISEDAPINCESTEKIPYNSSDPDTYLCIGGNKYQKIAVYNSPLCNNDKELTGYKQGLLLEENSSDCEATMLFRWVDTDDTYCIEQ